MAKQYSAAEIVLSSGDGTQTYFNIEYKSLEVLRENFMVATSEPGAIMLPPGRKKFITTERNALNEATIRNILDVELLEDHRFCATFAKQQLLQCQVMMNDTTMHAPNAQRR